MTDSPSLEININDYTKEDLRQYTFVDIREPMEVMMQSVKGVETIKLPLSQYEDSDFEFEKDKKYIIFCAVGGRSLALTEQLHEQGITNTVSLSGGIGAIEGFYGHE